MAKTYQPPFTQNAKIGLATIAAANTARDGSGTIVTAFTAGADDAYVKRIIFIPAQASAAAIGAKVFCVFLSNDGGTTWFFANEVAIVTSTPSTTAIAIKAVISFPDGFVLPANWVIGVTQTIYAGAQDRTSVIVEGSDY
jgi:hypothetical protein